MLKNRIDTEKLNQAREFIREIDDGGCQGCLLHVFECMGDPCANCISGFTEAEIKADNLDDGTRNRIGIVDLIDMAIEVT